MKALLILLLAPLLGLAGAILYAAILFWPTMLFLGALHTWLVWVPALAWQATFLSLAVLYLLIPVGKSSVTSD